MTVQAVLLSAVGWLPVRTRSDDVDERLGMISSGASVPSSTSIY